MNPWSAFVIGVGSAFVLYGTYYYYRREYFCSTCGRRDHSRKSFVKCAACGKWICRNKLEIMEEASTSNKKYVEVTPTKTNRKFPCGTKFIDEHKKVKYYCRKDSPHVGYYYEVTIKK